MSNVLRMSRKAFTVSVVAATIAWSIGLSALITPLTARAVDAGTLVKGSLPAVYYVGADMKRYVFPNEKTYKTWYMDFSTVQTITDAELAAIPIGGNATYKPGVYMVKITTDPKVYAVASGGTLRWVTSESVANALYGANWNTMIHDVPDAFFVNYTIGADINSAGDFSPAGESSAATSISVDKGLGQAVSGSLSVAAAADMPAGGTLPAGASGVNMLKVKVMNGGASAVTVDSLTVRRVGAGVPGDFAWVYVYHGNDRLTTGRTINTSSNEASFAGLNMQVGPGATEYLWIAVDLAGAVGANNQHALQLVDLRSGATMASGLPVAGPNFSMSSAVAGTLQVDRAGAVPLSNVKAGSMGQKIGEFQLTAGAAEDLHVHRIALFNGGAVNREHMTNLVLKQAGLSLATAAGFDGRDRATFVLASPLLLEKGAMKTFEVYADIAAGARAGATETILVYVDSSTDVLAIGQTFGYGAMVDIGAIAGTYDGVGCALGAGNCSSTRIEGGQVNITFNGPAAKDVGVNGRDVELYNFTIGSASNLEVRNLRMRINATNAVGGAAPSGLIDTSGAGVANFTDIKVIDTATGATIAGPASLAVGGSDATQNITYTETWNLTAGQSRTFKVTADIANQALLAGDTASVDLLPFQANDLRNLDNSTYVVLTDIVPNTGINGNLHSMRAPSLMVGLASTPVAQTYIQGTQGVEVVGLTLQAGDASDIRVSSLALQGLLDSDDTVACANAPDAAFNLGQEALLCNSIAALVSTASLWDNGTQVGATKSPSTSTGAGTGGVLTFDNLNFTVPAGQTITLTMKVNLAGGQTLANMPDDIAFQVTAAGSVSATDPDGNTVAATAAGWPVLGPTMRVAGAGSLTVALAPSDTDSEAGLVVGGTSNAVLGKWKLTAQNEELKLVKVRFNTAAAAGVASMSLYDGGTLVGGPISVDGTGNASFSGMNFVIPKDGSKVLTLKGNLNAVGVGGAATGSAVTATMRDGYQGAAIDGTFEVRGTSAGSNTLIQEFGALLATNDIAGNAKILRKTKPTVSLVSLPSSIVQVGENVIMRFTVAADSAGDVALKHLNVAITASGGSVAAATATCGLRKVGDGTDLTATCALAGGVLSILLTNEEVVPAGTSKTFDVRINNTGTATTGDGFSSKLDITNDTAVIAGGVLAGAAGALTIGGTGADFVWSDNSAVPHSDVIGGPSSTDWTNGFYVKVLPSDAQTLSK